MFLLSNKVEFVATLMAKKRKKQIARKQRKQRRRNLTGLDFDSLMDLRNQVDEALTGYRSTLERQLEALGSSVASLGGRVARGIRGRTLKGRKVAAKYKGPSGELWAGRGARPRWLVAALKEGAKIEDFLIAKTVGKAKKGRKKKK
jgi:DNA-binding protein H-NS